MLERKWERDLKRQHDGRTLLPPPPTVCHGTAILVRGGDTLINDASFEVLETKLPDSALVEVIRFNYLGPDSPNGYTLEDNLYKLEAMKENPGELIGYLDTYIERLESVPFEVNKPIYLLGHSAGGLIIAHWLIRPGNVDRVDKVFFFATPFDPIDRSITVNFPSEQNPVHVLIPELSLQQLLQCCSNAIVVRCGDDGLYDDQKETSLKLNMGPGDPEPLDEKSFEEPGHFNVCNDKDVAEFVLEWITRDSPVRMPDEHR